MTLQEFIDKWSGKYLEVAGSDNALNQCVDLANGYIRDVLGFPIIEWTNAIDFPSKGGSNYTYIKNTPEGVPKKGDLVIWQPSPGHIAVFLDGDTSTFRSFDQNFPTGSQCHIQSHTYENVIGWMSPNSTIPVDKMVFESLVDKSTRYDKFVSAGYKSVEDVTARIVAVNTQLAAYQTSNDELTSKLAKASTELAAANAKLYSIRQIVNGSGWWWTRLLKIKQLFGTTT